MTTEFEVLDALVTTLATLRGLKVYHYPEPGMTTPAAFPLLFWPLPPTWPARVGPIDCEIVVLTTYGAGLSREGAKLLSEYVSGEGERSILRKLGWMPGNGNSTLGGVVQDIRLVEVSKPKLFTFAPPDTKAYWGRSVMAKVFLKDT